MEDAKKCAELLQAIAEPNRIRIIECLSQGPKNVTELHKLLDVAIVNVSHHLGVLRAAKLVQAEKRGRFVVYSLDAGYFKPQGTSPATHLDLGRCKIEFPNQQ
jgi:ArsR family transcriptional regulator, nickel/cobalt-responsive transcriptional repressor